MCFVWWCFQVTFWIRCSIWAVICTWLSLMDKGWVHGLTLTTVDKTPHHTPTPSTNQNPPSFSLSFHPHSARPGLRPWHGIPHLSLWRLCGWHAVGWYADRSPWSWLWIKTKVPFVFVVLPLHERACGYHQHMLVASNKKAYCAVYACWFWCMPKSLCDFG